MTADRKFFINIYKLQQSSDIQQESGRLNSVLPPH